MNRRVDVNENLWFLAYTQSRDVFHFGFAESPAILTSGQQILETFATESELASRIDALKGIVGWYEANKPIEPANYSNIT